MSRVRLHCTVPTGSHLQEVLEEGILAHTILYYLILTEQKHCSPQNAMLHHGTKTGYHIVYRVKDMK